MFILGSLLLEACALLLYNQGFFNELQGLNLMCKSS